MESNLMMPKTQSYSASRAENVNTNKIKVRVVSPAVCREVEVVPSVNLGSRRNVSSCYNHAEFLVQNYMNIKRSGEPARFLSFRNGSWVDIEKELFDVLKSGFTEGNSVEVQVGGRDCIFDFYRMLQFDVVSWSRRSIAWFDVNGQPFFPKVFVDSEEVEAGEDSMQFEKGEDFDVRENVQLPNIEIEIKIPEKREDLKSPENESASNKRKWVNDENDEVSSSNFPAKKLVAINNDVVERPLWPKTRMLRREEQGYKAVQSMFLSGFGIIDPRAKITRIHQWISNGPMEKARFEVFQLQLELTKKARGDAKMVFAWYGGTANEVETVLSHGFRMPTKFLGSAPQATGVYLTPVKSPHISAMFSEPGGIEEKHVILCRVILGNCEKVEAGSCQSFPSSMEYDTGVDDLMNPKWYIVWVPNMNTHIIPECVVSFKTAGTGPPVPVPQGGTTLSSKLFTKLRNALPPQKSRELQVLCASFNEGKMDKDVFLKLLRVVAGDEVLRVAIREII